MLPLGCPQGRPLGIPGAPSCQTPGWTVFVPPLRHPLVRPPGQPVPRLPLLTLGSDPQDRLSLYHLQGTPRASPGQKPRTACPLVTPESPPGDPQNVPGSDPQDGLSLCHPQVAPGRSLGWNVHVSLRVAPRSPPRVPQGHQRVRSLRHCPCVTPRVPPEHPRSAPCHTPRTA